MDYTYSTDRLQWRAIAEKPLLAFDPTGDFAAQKKAIRERLLTQLGDRPVAVPPEVTVEYTHDEGDYIEHRLSFWAEEDARAVCLLCIPKLGKKKYPLAICLQGHSTGMHISMNRDIYRQDKAEDLDRDIARQALAHGFAALCVEQRGMGERRTSMVWSEDDDGAPRCHSTAMISLLLGRTIIGERRFDISRALDIALTYPEIDPDRILCTGNSGGGTATYYAACLDERIKVAMPCCSVCTFKDSIAAIRHCECNYVPGLAKYMDMGDMAACIAPRRLIVIHGDEDPIFPDAGVREAYATIQKVYEAAGVPENCALVTGHGDHRYFAEGAWSTFDRLADWAE